VSVERPFTTPHEAVSRRNIYAATCFQNTTGVDMTKIEKTLMIIGCLSLTASAMLSAYGFHGLGDTISPEEKASWGWAVDMQYYHSLGLVIIGWLGAYLGGSLLIRLAGGLMILGMIIFSGLIYAEILGAPESIGEIVPMGGTCFMISWVLVAIAVFRAKNLGRQSTGPK
jgi:uncharacterized membrane protein YgdD (TMEM256/DUF423 family)